MRLTVKKADSKELVIHPAKDPKADNTYLKNLRMTDIEDQLLPYKEISEAYEGFGNKNCEILLSGYETCLKLTDIACTSPTQLTLENKKREILFSTTIAPGEEMQEISLPLSGVTVLTIKVDTEVQKEKWQFRVEVQ